MPSQKQDSETKTEPWEGFQPYLIGKGPIPEWAKQGPPQGLSEAMMARNAAMASGAPGAWNMTVPRNEDGTLDFYGSLGVPGAPGAGGGGTAPPVSNPAPPGQFSPIGSGIGGFPVPGVDFPVNFPDSGIVSNNGEGGFGGLLGPWAQGIWDTEDDGARSGLIRILGGMS